MTVVLDANVVVAALIDSGRDGAWAEDLLIQDGLASPHLMMVEVANILRRSVLAGEVSADASSLAHNDLLDLRIDLFSYGAFAPRIWELRGNVTCLRRLVRRARRGIGGTLGHARCELTRAAGPRCRFLTR